MKKWEDVINYYGFFEDGPARAGFHDGWKDAVVNKTYKAKLSDPNSRYRAGYYHGQRAYIEERRKHYSSKGIII